MRAAAVSVVLCFLVLAVASPVEAKPFPQAQAAARHMVRDTLQDADHTTAKLLREAHGMIREARENATALLPSPGSPALPALPAPPQNAPLEVRAVMTQPGFQGQDDILAVLWIGATSGTWTGAYWVQSDDGMVFPNLLEVNEEGLLLFMYGGSLSLDDSIDDASYHFLGIDGAHVTTKIPSIPLLDGVPVLDRVSLAGADASSRGKAPEALFLAPWNTMAENVTMGVTLLDDGVAREEFTIAGCDDPSATVTEAGCRLIYVLELAPEITDLELWHLDADGNRIVDETHDRLSLEMGVTYSP